jgi:hypothetical protein
MTQVDVGNGQVANVELRAGQDPAEVAAAFCSDRHLPLAVIEPLAAHLREQLAMAVEQEAARGGTGATPGSAGRKVGCPLALQLTPPLPQLATEALHCPLASADQPNSDAITA